MVQCKRCGKDHGFPVREDGNCSWCYLEAAGHFDNNQIFRRCKECGRSEEGVEPGGIYSSCQENIDEDPEHYYKGFNLREKKRLRNIATENRRRVNAKAFINKNLDEQKKRRSIQYGLNETNKVM